MFYHQWARYYYKNHSVSQLQVFFFLQFYSHYQEVPCCVNVNEIIQISGCVLPACISTSWQSILCAFSRFHRVPSNLTWIRLHGHNGQEMSHSERRKMLYIDYEKLKAGTKAGILITYWRGLKCEKKPLRDTLGDRIHSRRRRRSKVRKMKHKCSEDSNWNRLWNWVWTEKRTQNVCSCLQNCKHIWKLGR